TSLLGPDTVPKSRRSALEARGSSVQLPYLVKAVTIPEMPVGSKAVRIVQSKSPVSFSPPNSLAASLAALRPPDFNEIAPVQPEICDFVDWFIAYFTNVLANTLSLFHTALLVNVSYPEMGRGGRLIIPGELLAAPLMIPGNKRGSGDLSIIPSINALPNVLLLALKALVEICVAFPAPRAAFPAVCAAFPAPRMTLLVVRPAFPTLRKTFPVILVVAKLLNLTEPEVPASPSVVSAVFAAVLAAALIPGPPATKLSRLTATPTVFITISPTAAAQAA